MTPSDPTQSGKTKVLFVCSRNRRRSLTAETIFSGNPAVVARSAGTQPEARITLTEGHIGWANIIFCMEKSHLNRMRLKFGDILDSKQIITLHIPDDFDYMQQELIDELMAKVPPHLKLKQAPSG